MSSNTIFSVASSNTAGGVQLRTGKVNRQGCIIFNESTAILYVALDQTGVSITSYTVQIAAGGNWTTPPGYTGPIWGIWAAVNGSARVTEF